MAKEKKTCSVLELPLVTELWQEDILDVKMDCVRRIYNNMLSDMLKKYHEMIKTREWRNLNNIIRDELQKTVPGEKRMSPELKAAYDKKNQILRENDFSEFGFISTVAKYSKYYQKHVSSSIASRCVAKPMWKAFEKLLFGNGEKVSFKPIGSVNTLASEGRTGIRFIQEESEYYVVLSNRNAKARVVKIKVKGLESVYENEMLNANIKMVRIVRKFIKGRREYYCQLVVDRTPYLKLNEDGSLKHPVSLGAVGIAVWRDTLCAVSANRVVTYELIPEGDNYAVKRPELTREMESIRRADNPENYEEDGTIKKGIVGADGKRRRLRWYYSPKYRKIKTELRELYRYHSVCKDLLHNRIILDILSMGDEFYIVDTSFLSKKPEWDEEEPLEQSEYKKKKARRRSIQEGAPAGLLVKLDNKLIARNLLPVQRIELPESLYWYRHDCGVSDERLFDGLEICIEGKRLSQTLYRAYLIKHYDIVNKAYNQKELFAQWDNFVSVMKG